MRRRKFITLVVGAVAWPFGARAQQSAMPVIGFLDAGSPSSVTAQRMGIIERSLAEAGYNPGRNVVIEDRFVVNMNTAKAIGLAIPESFLLHADEVIE
jgi:putative tryptophan/tyrosine transport system substrate-binding protein